MYSDARVTSFTPSVSAIREHRARQQADRIIDQFATRFIEGDFFPEDSDGLLFAMLTQLPQWSADTELSVVDEEGDVVASYLKYNDASVVNRTITLLQYDDGSYSAPGGMPAIATESLFKLIFSQLPTTSELGMGGNFPGANSVAGRIVTVREQIAELARDNRPMLFQALQADADAAKNDPQVLSNPFLPFWTRSTGDRSIALAMLQVLYPQMPVERLEELLRNHPLTHAEEADLLHDEVLPEAFAAALEASLKECATHRAIDGIQHTRIYGPDTDALARALAGRLLKNMLDRELVIVERDQPEYESTGPDDTLIVLWHAGDGEYLRADLRAEQIREPRKGTDSFYLNIIDLLKPDERALLLVRFEADAAGLRALLADVAVAENGGWFMPEPLAEIDEFMPDWFREASAVDKLAWRGAVQDYSQAMVEAQAPGLPGLEKYGEPAQLRDYAREKLRERLKLDHGLELEPDEILIETSHTQVIGPDPVDSGFGIVDAPEPADVIVTTEVRDLIDLCLQNLSITDLNFLRSSRVLARNGARIPALTPSYVFTVVRELNVGENYTNFLRTRLLNSQEGKWSQERHARVMQAQMRLDALEAKMAGDYRESGNLPAERRDRAYKWVTAVLDNPVDDALRATVEGHKIAVGQVQVNGVRLDGLLLIGVSSRKSVPSFVVYTPLAPDGRCFRELSSWHELREDIFGNAAFLDYLVGLAPRASQSIVRNALTVKLRDFVLSPVLLGADVYETAYRAQVERVIASVDEQTQSTWEQNWESAWEIASFVGETALLFTPFKVALPVAAFRSLYAVTQGIRNAATGDQKAALYFVEAALLLTDGLPRANASKARSSIRASAIASKIDPKKALVKAPQDLKPRTDGRYNGVYEVTRDAAPSSFYVKHAGDTYPVRYDTDLATWRLIDPRRPDAYYQMPIVFKEGGWVHARLGLLGGMPKKVAATPTKRFELDISGLKDDKTFRKADKYIQDSLLKSANEVVEEYTRRGGGKFHGYTPKGSKVKIFTLDLTGMPNSTGRGAWRLQLVESGKGTLVLDKVLSSH